MSWIDEQLKLEQIRYNSLLSPNPKTYRMTRNISTGEIKTFIDLWGIVKSEQNKLLLLLK